jgi:hypothetical protein
MSKSVRSLCLAAVLALTFSPLPTLAQEPSTIPDPVAEPRSSGGFDRLFLSFIEDAVAAERQWWEIQGEISEMDDADALDLLLARGIVAFQLWEDVEIGGRIAFGRSDSESGTFDGTGATDLDLWAKYLIPSENQQLDMAVGGILTLPTGDDTAGLGYDAFSIGFFGSARYRLEHLILTGNLGFRVNDDGTTRGRPEVDGETSPRFGAGVIFPLADDFDVTGEFTWEDARFEGNDEDMRLAAGLVWRLGQRNMFRGAFVGGASDGAPDWQVLASYAVQFP